MTSKHLEMANKQSYNKTVTDINRGQNMNSGKKILIILTGGTICSQYEGNVKVQGSCAGTVLQHNFNASDSPFAGSVTFKETENYGLFSENMTVSKWNMLIQSFRTLPEIHDTAAKRGSFASLAGKKNVPENIYDGIIIAHGTDTLAYSSALFSIILKDMGIPVFLVSSNEALSSEKANGSCNFRAAVECICCGIKPNVYAAYKNTGDGRMYLHLASRLKQCESYSEDFFSAGMLDITGLTPENAGAFFKNLPIPQKNKSIKIDFFNESFTLENAVLKIEPYVGLDYDFFDFGKAEAVLHLTYHSGTVCSEKTEKNPDYSNNSILHLLDKCPTLPVYIAPSDLSGGIYETVPVIAEHKSGRVFFVNGCTAEMLYVKLLIAYSLKLPEEKITEFLQTEYNCEAVCEKLTVVKKQA